MKPSALALAALVLLAGCASATPEPTPSPVVREANDVACTDFAQETISLLNAVARGGNAEDWDEGLDALDSIALKAEGDVKERMLTFISDVPSIGDVYVYEEARELVNDQINSVKRACSADGYDRTFNTFVIG